MGSLVPSILHIKVFGARSLTTFGSICLTLFTSEIFRAVLARVFTITVSSDRSQRPLA